MTSHSWSWIDRLDERLTSYRFVCLSQNTRANRSRARGQLWLAGGQRIGVRIEEILQRYFGFYQKLKNLFLT